MNAPHSPLPPLTAVPSVSDEPEVPSAAECARIAATVIRTQLAQRPYVALGAAVGVGFVVAGGLASPAVWSLARLGTRIAFALATRKVGDALLAHVSAATDATS